MGTEEKYNPWKQPAERKIERQDCMERMDTADNGDREERRSNSSTDSATENISVTIASEHGTHVQLLLKVDRLKPKSSASRWYHKLGKPVDPSVLVSNAEVRTWRITDQSFKVVLDVKTDRKAAKSHEKREKKLNKGGQPMDESAPSPSSSSKPDLQPGWERFHLNLRQLPSEIIAEQTAFDVAQPSGRDYAFIELDFIKKDTQTSWQQYARDNGSLDVCSST